jgi:hypothetical protein
MYAGLTQEQQEYVADEVIVFTGVSHPSLRPVPTS